MTGLEIPGKNMLLQMIMLQMLFVSRDTFVKSMVLRMVSLCQVLRYPKRNIEVGCILIRNFLERFACSDTIQS